MNLTNWLAALSWDDVEAVLYKYESLGPIPGILAPMIESFLPFLPLVAIIVANVNAYGLWEGFFLSWAGVSLGAISVFLLVRLLGGRFRKLIERKFPRGGRFIHWLESHGFTPVFLLACFPFTPSSVVNVVAGISGLPWKTFAIATVLGKGVMILLVSFVGNDIDSMFRQPWKLVMAVVVLVGMWFLGRKIEARYMK